MANEFHHKMSQMDEAKTYSGDVPLHRSYGVKKRLRPWQEKMELGISKIFLFWILGVLLFVSSVSVICFFLYFPEMWIKLVIGIAVGVIFTVRRTRTIRKRAKFSRSLKKMCREKKFRLTREQSFFASLIWSGNREDFVLETGSCIYYARYLTVGKYRSTVYLEKPDEIRLVKRPLQNKFTTIFDIHPRVKHYPLDFEIGDRVSSVWEHKRVVKAMIVNPVCEDMRYKKKDGGYETTGNGGTHFGYTIFTASGFLETVRRNENAPKQTVEH